MDKEDVVNFLLKFDIKEDIINDFLKNKHVINVNSNVFLVSKSFEKGQIYGDIMLFIQLSKLLPTRFLLEFIKNNSNYIEISDEKLALDFTYSRSLTSNQVKSPLNVEFVKDRCYIVYFDGAELGYVLFNGNKFLNQMNIGQYLSEN